MRRLTFIALALILASAALSPAAVAATPVQHALKIAETYWGPSRCQGELHLEYSSTPPAAGLPIEATVEAWAMVNTPAQYRTLTGPLVWTSPVYIQCTVYFNTAVWPDEQTMQANFPEFCQIMIHEYGHFMGWLDSTTAFPETDIRYPLMTSANMPKVCLPPRPFHVFHHGETTKRRRHHRGFER